MNILGISCFYHDAAAALLQDGRPVAMAEEERFTRKKHDYDFPEQAIRFVLDAAKLKPQDLDYVVFYEKPFLKFERLLKTILTTVPSSLAVFREAMVTWLLDKLWIKDIIRSRLGVPVSKILFSEHHLSHAASAFYGSPYEEAAIVTVDGVGEWATASVGVGRGNEIKILKEIHFPHSLGLLYSAFTAYLGFEVNEGEYKVMGMAPYGKPQYADRVRKLLRLYDDGSFELDLDWFDFHHSIKRTYSDRFIRLFGEPRDPRSKFFTRTSGWPSYFGPPPSNFDELARQQEYYADVAASIQAVLEEAVINLARSAQRETGLKRLCMAGGVALNSVANWKIIRQTEFEEIFIQPAAGDAGGALGAALFVEHGILNRPRRFLFNHCYWGESFGDTSIREFLESKGIRYEYVPKEEELLDRVVSELTGGSVVGWFHGGFEWGPRALGARSILADARRADMKDIVNTKIKFREPYRPFAPSVIVENAEDYFDIPDARRHHPARYMLYVVDVKNDKREVVPAITHVDGTGRLQTVYSDVSPRYWKLINRFREATGVPLILNTSFNLKGEPIVSTPAQAFNTFSKSGMDALVLENFIVRKPV
ncbi:MAG: hypothetical protein HYY13_08705 [Nitrospirae bacterium]|nr:hypothetical protein [Nitrospirota bacterium]